MAGFDGGSAFFGHDLVDLLHEGLREQFNRPADDDRNRGGHFSHVFIRLHDLFDAGLANKLTS